MLITHEDTDTVAVETIYLVQITLSAPGAPFRAVLYRENTSWFDDDPTPDIDQEIVCERDLTVSLPAVFSAVDSWLVREHRMRTVPNSWQAGEFGADTGVALMLEARAAAATRNRDVFDFLVQ
ncbi:hypothetical protein B5P44_00445 [Mycobacterium sp. CBMA 213]|uniref:Uncharacterized protein n=1 Tax=Mycolicibacterium sp. CBMA 213 TaxID=1968788 RepID=A0A343VR69_9MYCO|nr:MULTISPECIES: hypothetical protein [unclassified Mycolicibacterium]AVN58393.1 hypothetical protein B5P44_p00098 [Mycolicibacterium sp. CBMA 213]MUL61054.1 hypothetical protein [Mycolicibacterium sp. CBMA 335]MUM03292.1 hypothetical protein [Mycolicibacterium sp. CBMA 213]